MNIRNLSETTVKIGQLKALDLSKLSLEDVKKELNTLPFPYNTFLQEPGAYTFRGQVNNDESPFKSVSRISYNPQPSKYIQRASLPGDTVFYASDGLSIVAHEAIQDAIRRTDEKVFFATVGKWKINRSLQIIELLSLENQAYAT